MASMSPLENLDPHPPGDEQYVIRWHVASKSWVRFYFVGDNPLERRWTAPELPPYEFTKLDLARMRAATQAIADGFYNEGPGPLPPFPFTDEPPDPPSD